MDINAQEILELIAKGESTTLEFKESKTSINRSVYQTICSFLNRHGGTVLLGVQDSGHIQGVSPDFIEKKRVDCQHQ